MSEHGLLIPQFQKTVRAAVLAYDECAAQWRPLALAGGSTTVSQPPTPTNKDLASGEGKPPNGDLVQGGTWDRRQTKNE